MLLTIAEIEKVLSTISYQGWEMYVRQGRTEGMVFTIKGRLEDNFQPGQDFSFE